MFEREYPHEEVSKKCEDLASIMKLKQGEIQITISNGKAVKIEVCRHVRVCCVRRKANTWVAPEDAGELLMDQVPEFVTKQLETLIVARVGRYGYLEAFVENGSVTRLLLNIAVRPRRRRPRRRSAIR